MVVKANQAIGREEKHPSKGRNYSRLGLRSEIHLQGVRYVPVGSSEKTSRHDSHCTVVGPLLMEALARQMTNSAPLELVSDLPSALNGGAYLGYDRNYSLTHYQCCPVSVAADAVVDVPAAAAADDDDDDDGCPMVQPS